MFILSPPSQQQLFLKKICKPKDNKLWLKPLTLSLLGGGAGERGVERRVTSYMEQFRDVPLE